VLDLRWVIANLDETKRRLATRSEAAAAALAPIEGLAAERRKLIQQSESRRAEQRKASDEMRTLKGEEQARLRARLKAMSDEVKQMEGRLEEVEEKIEAALLGVPNLPHESVPVGTESADNPVVRTWGEKPRISFKPKQHDELGEALGMLDFERAAKVSGARFVFYKGDLARLERALVAFFIDLQRERGYLEMIPPYLVNADSMRGTGQLPKFEEDLFKTTAGLYLIPTAEVPVTNYHRDEILAGLPIKYCAFSPCFRSEAGSYGKDTKGIVRQHQFHKVELVRFEEPERAHAALEQLVDDAQEPLRRLGLHHRVVALCTGDLGFSAEKTYDIEVWLPGQGMFREISSCSNCGEFQARRMSARYRSKEGRRIAPVHTLNGSGVAVGRALIAVMETYQQGNGSIAVPDALQPYMGGVKTIE
jgi:seryl-tRNA synthetase